MRWPYACRLLRSTRKARGRAPAVHAEHATPAPSHLRRVKSARGRVPYRAPGAGSQADPLVPRRDLRAHFDEEVLPRLGLAGDAAVPTHDRETPASRGTFLVRSRAEIALPEDRRLYF